MREDSEALRASSPLGARPLPSGGRTTASASMMGLRSAGMKRKVQNPKSKIQGKFNVSSLKATRWGVIDP
jgi:hypothetical protein